MPGALVVGVFLTDVEDWGLLAEVKHFDIMMLVVLTIF